MALSLARGFSQPLVTGARCLSSAHSRYVMALTTDQQRLRQRWREESSPPVSARPAVTSRPESIVVANLRAQQSSERQAETGPRLAADLRQMAAELDAMDCVVAQDELSELATDNLKCGGCGVQLQTSAPDDLGFIDPKLLSDAITAVVTPATNKPSTALPVDALRRDSLVCRRCLLLTSTTDCPPPHPPPAAACESAFAAIAALPAATVLLVADMPDLDASLVPDLFSRLGKRDYVLVGNKVDQLLPDAAGSMDRWREALRRAGTEVAGIPRRSLRGVELVSALTGFGLEQLVTVLTNNDLKKQPVFLVGCANVGKSSLFNRLRQSDLCKPVARPHVHAATESLWPGTTLQTLRFPLATMTASLRRRRFERLREKWREESRRARAFYDPPAAAVGITAEPEVATVVDQHQSFSSLPTYAPAVGGPGMQSSLYTKAVVEERYLHEPAYDERRLSSQRWCYDTPGYPHPGQLSNFLTLDEIAVLRGSHSRLRFLPRTFVVRPGRSLLLGGIARVDVVEAPSSLLLTALTNLPLHILPSEQAQAYIDDLGADLRCPDPAAPRPRPLPPPSARLFPLRLPICGELHSQTAGVDLAFAGAGWVAVTVPPTARQDGEETHANLLLCTHFPHGLQVVQRPPLLPFCVRQRGRRVGSTLEYRQPRDMVARKFVDSRSSNKG